MGRKFFVNDIHVLIVLYCLNCLKKTIVTRWRN